MDADKIRELLRVMEESQRPCEVDWVNRRIVVLSEVRTHPTRTLSGGRPLTFQDYLFHWSDQPNGGK